jgi:membrane protease YdiL (CAAX protease family)
MDAPLLRPFWGRIARQAWIVSAVLFVVLAGIRAAGLFGPTSTRMLIMLGFFLMWFTPIVFLTKAGRRRIGIRKPVNAKWMVAAPFIGAAGGLTLFALGYWWFGTGPDNWYMSILRSWDITDGMQSDLGTLTLFLMFAIPSALFSPIGEEIFFRGFVHESFRERWGYRVALAANALAFAAVHGLHHGFQPGHFRPWSGLLWVALIAGVVMLFQLCKERAGSIWASVLCHSAFNVAMTATVIFVLL